MKTKVRLPVIAGASALLCSANLALVAAPASADSTPDRTVTITVSAAGSAQTILSAEGYYQNQQRHGSFVRTFPWKRFGMYQAAAVSVDGSGVWCRVEVDDQVVVQQRADGVFATVACIYTPFTD